MSGPPVVCVERETGVVVPSTKQLVEFSYRFA